jgi:hypothetical protein
MISDKLWIQNSYDKSDPSQSQSYITTDGQSTSYGFVDRGALSDEKSGL